MGKSPSKCEITGTSWFLIILTPYITIISVITETGLLYKRPPTGPLVWCRRIFTSPPEGVARYCFHPVCLSVCVCVCLCVCVCVRPIFWYFISRLLEEISIWNLCRIFIGWYSIHWKNIDLHRSMVKVTETVNCFLKVQSYHKNWALEKFQFFFIDTS